MLAELIEFNICKKLEPCKMTDFIGEEDPLRHRMEKYYGFFIDPSMAQLR